MIAGFQMPVFLYKDYTYNPEDPKESLFRGTFLVCVSPHSLSYPSPNVYSTCSFQVLIDILFGRNTVDTVNVKREDQPCHNCVGEMYEVTMISRWNIAYAAVEVSDSRIIYLLIH
jgi:hypothetical protein